MPPIFEVSSRNGGHEHYEKCNIDYVCTYEFVIPPELDEIRNFSEGLAPVEIKGEMGIYK